MSGKMFLKISAVLLCILFCGLFVWFFYPGRTYKARHFGIETVKSSVDYNKNGIDDYTDILMGAKKDAENRPRYDGAYVEGGYPEDNVGVCTDVVWRSFKNAGYNLRDMVDRDIKRRPNAYARIKKPDSNIDFRRVPNLHIFFEEYAISLTTDITKIDQWQPGDIVIFKNDKHIGIISDKRNSKGVAYLIHNGGQLKREEDYLSRSEIIAHYRFDASVIDSDILSPWTE